MNDLDEFSKHVDDFNSRCLLVTQKISATFSINIDFEPVDVQKPRFYDSRLRHYVRESQSQIVNRFNQLSNQLQQLRLAPPVNLANDFSWSDVDAALSKIENKVMKY